MNEPTATRTKLVAFFAVMLSLSGLSCFLLHALIHVSARSFHDTRIGQPLPWITTLCFDLRFAILLLPVPWLAIALWSIARNNISAFWLIVFTSTLLFVLLSATVFTFVTLALPWLPIRIALRSP